MKRDTRLYFRALTYTLKCREVTVTSATCITNFYVAGSFWNLTICMVPGANIMITKATNLPMSLHALHFMSWLQISLDWCYRNCSFGLNNGRWITKENIVHYCLSSNHCLNRKPSIIFVRWNFEMGGFKFFWCRLSAFSEPISCIVKDISYFLSVSADVHWRPHKWGELFRERNIPKLWHGN